MTYHNRIILTLGLAMVFAAYTLAPKIDVTKLG